jgi:hypothetical protein
MYDSLDEDDPWVDISVSDVKSFMDACLGYKPAGRKASRRVSLPRSSIKAALLGVLNDKDQQIAEELLHCEHLEDLLGRFLKKDPWWVIRCEVTNSMVSSRWGLKAFVLKDRGYIYYLPDDDCTEEASTLPILEAWDPVKDKVAYRSAVLMAYINHWQEALLPPYRGQWASGPFDVMLEAVSKILRRCPDDWSVVLNRLDRVRVHDRKNSSLERLTRKTSLKMGLRKNEVKEILLPYTSTDLIGNQPSIKDLSEDRKRVVVGAYLCLIDGIC